MKSILKTKNETRLVLPKKASDRLKSIRYWQDGMSITEISNTLKCTRQTIYRWLQSVDQRLSKNESRKREDFSVEDKNKIIEAYILCKRPSMRVLSEILLAVFGLKIPPTRLRRALRRWNLDSYRPSGTFDSLKRYQHS